MTFWVYMLRCADDSYYTGHTEDIERRLAQHNAREFSGYTSRRLPVALVFSQGLPSREEALGAELQIKRWGRKKKTALIEGDWSRLSALSRRGRS